MTFDEQNAKCWKLYNDIERRKLACDAILAEKAGYPKSWWRSQQILWRRAIYRLEAAWGSPMYWDYRDD